MEGLVPAHIVIHTINVVVLFGLLRLILWKPVIRFMREREERVSQQLSDAAGTMLEADGLKQEYERNIENVEAHGREILRESQTRASEQSAALLSAAKIQADQMIADARDRIEEERKRAVELAKYDISVLATELASRILHREVSPQDDLAAVMDFFDDGQENNE